MKSVLLTFSEVRQRLEACNARLGSLGSFL